MLKLGSITGRKNKQIFVGGHGANSKIPVLGQWSSKTNLLADYQPLQATNANKKPSVLVCIAVATSSPALDLISFSLP